MTATFVESDHPRSPDGTFANKAYADAGQLDLGGFDEPEDEFSFDFDRMESLMGSTLLLDADRQTPLPKVKDDDTIFQITTKLTGYVGKTQDFSAMSDEQVLERLGLEPTERRPLDRFVSQLNPAENDRILYAADPNNPDRSIMLSLGSSLKKPGNYVNGWTAENASSRMLKSDLTAKMLEQHPELDAKEVERQMNRLFDRRYGGKGREIYWRESALDDSHTLALAGALAAENPDWSPEQCLREAQELGKSDDLGPALERIRALPTASSWDGTTYHAGSFRGRLWTVSDTTLDELENGTRPAARTAQLNRAYRALLDEEFALERDFRSQRKFVRDAMGEHTARVFEQKKNVPQEYLDAADRSFFKTSGDFKHVEIDSDADLEKVSQVAAEYEALRDYLPKTSKAPTLRFRKTGRHRAAGIYHPHVDNISVDPRSPHSALHELVHHVDYTAGNKNISESEEYRPLLRKIQHAYGEAAKNGTMSAESAKKLDYLETPTETLSRTAELYYHWKGVKTTLNGDDEHYAGDHYTPLYPFKDEIVAFWDAKLPQLGAKPVPSQV